VLSRPNSWRAAVAAADTGRFVTTEDFLAACDEEVRSATDRILRTWAEQSRASMRFNRIGVSLDVRNPFKSQGGVTSVFVLDTKGRITVNRGYLLDGALVRDPFTADLDTQIRTLFPTGRWGRESYYVSVGSPPDADAAEAFQAWLTLRIEELTTTG
jgi:hypothetical protein